MSAGEVFYAEDGTASMVLDDKVDPNYEPTKKELDEYAQWLGIDPDKEKDLMWIAREGLKAPLPDSWKPCKTDTDDVYYFNFSTGESIWEHPLDEHYKKKVTDERAKLKKKKKDDPSGSKKLEKGAAGNDIPPAAAKAGTSAAASTLPAPVKGRLGALGSDNAARPDISALVPESLKAKTTVPAVFALPSSSKEVKDTSAEDERKLRATLQKENDDVIAKLRAKLDEELAEKSAQQKQELARLEKDLKNRQEEEVDDATRAAERRTKREMQMFEESIERQLEDLRRTARQEQQRLDAEQAASALRVEQDLATKKRASDMKIESQVAARRGDILTQWHAEKAAAEALSERTVEEMRRAHVSQVDALTKKEQDRVAQRILTLNATLDEEFQKISQSLEREHNDAVANLQRQSSTSNGSHAPEYQQAEAKYADAIAQAKSRATAAHSAERLRFSALRQQLADQHTQKMHALRDASASMKEARKAKMQAELSASAETRFADVSRALENDLKHKESAARQATTDLIDAARARSDARIGAAKSELSSEAQSITARHAAAERAEQEQIRAQHEERLEELRQRHSNRSVDDTIDIEAEKRQWLAENPPPAPIATSGGNVDVEAAVRAEQQQCDAVTRSKIEALQRTQAEELKQLVSAHRAKALSEMDQRVSVYAAERRLRRVSSAPSSPSKAPVVVMPATELSADAERFLAVERARLQARLDELAMSLASSGQPPRPSSAPSRDLPQLRGSGSSMASPLRERAAPAQLFASSGAGVEILTEANRSHPERDASHHERVMSRRIERAKQRIKQEKATIRSRIESLEAARGEWRRDMRRAKEERDYKLQQILHVAKGVLEERARVLNDDTAALKASIDLLKKEERKLTHDDDAEGDKVYDMLKSIAAKVDHVETKIRRSTPTGSRRDPSPYGRSVTADKWSRMLQQPPSRHIDVGMWLDQTSSQ